MNGQDDALAIRRILVALDSSYHSLAALEAAAELATALRAELEGLFVEDINLLRLAAVPVAREVRYPCVATGNLTRARMERELRAQASQAREALAAACRNRNIKWSFRVVRGEVSRQVLEAALGVDLLSLGRASRPLTRRVRLGSTARAAAMRAPRPVLLSQHDVRIKPPILVTYDGSPASQQALEVAIPLARRNGGYLTILILADTQETAGQLRDQVADRVRGLHLFVRYQRLADASVATLADRARTERGGLLVLSGATFPADMLEALLDDVQCPVLMIR
jgi:nucleotide-binding universal stress UspA family protein